MNIVLATPLYPPDIAQPASYIKELARRLGKEHSVTIVTYGRLPEQVEKVRILAIDKRAPLPLRLARFTVALLRAARQADVVYAENGSSVELPVTLITLLTRCPLVMHLGDAAAHARAQRRPLLRFLERLAVRRARVVLAEMPPQRPEILPFRPPPTATLATYEQSWSTHLRELENTFVHVA